MINFGLAREIYGLNPWFVDQQTLPGLLSLVNSFQSGATIEIPEIKYNSLEIIPLNATKIVDRPFGNRWSPGQLDSKEDFVGIGIINLDGPITIGGGQSSTGMREVAATMKKMALDSRMVSFIILTDSGGGSSGAVKIMSDAINIVKQTKPVIGLIKQGGVAASAAYGILSAANAIYAEDGMSVVGSAGTMVQFEGRAANSTNADGVKSIRIYAPESKMKNKGFEEALNNDNYQVIIDEMLTPINDNFLNLILSNRPSLEGFNFRDGHTTFAKNAIGTFIDGIKSFEETIQEAVNIASVSNPQINNSTNQININSKEEVMTVKELKQNHPETYNAIFAAGGAEQKDLAGAWMAHLMTDPAAVKAGIESGVPISATQREEFLVKGASLSHLKALQTDSSGAAPVAPAIIEDAKTADEKELESFYANVDSKLNPSKEK
jgi:ClpP class serine protease